jgi:hypothetical protein
MAAGEDDDAMPGQDSFIDVVCNMVGILIVLVMIVGVRATGADSEPQSTASPIRAAAGYKPADADAVSELSDRQRQALRAQREIEDAVQRLADLGAQSTLVDARRQQLSLVKAAVEQDVQQRRSKLTAEEQRQFDVQRQIAEAEVKLHQLTQEQISLVAASTVIEEIECVPTPIAREVTGESVHIQLRNGLLAVLPTDELLAEVHRRGFDYLRGGLNHRNYAEEMFGPIDGFRMRVLVARREEQRIPGAPMEPDDDRPGLFLKFNFFPTSDDLGQPIEQALLPDSKFMLTLRSAKTAAPSVVAWVYGDSYAELRTLKRAMWKVGTPLAVNPMVEGYPIGFVSGGSRVVAQ